jgi:cytochrome c peroxidase
MLRGARHVLWLLLALVACENDVSDPPPTEPTKLDRALEYFGLDLVPSPGNPLTAAGVALGRRLFYEPILSGDSTLACAGCHKQANAFSDAGHVFSRGIHGVFGYFNTPALVNPGWGTSFFWNGRAPSLEVQALEPVPNPIEMDLPWNQAIPRLQAHPQYPGLFAAAFGTTTITPDLVTRAIAQFERTLVSIDSPYDRAQRGEQQLGFDAFMGVQHYRSETIGDCFHCHGVGPIFDNSVFPTNPNVFVNNGLDSVPDEGLYAVTGNEADRGKFKAPTLRNLVYSAPYMHDGRFATLEDVVRFYNTGIRTDSPNMNLKLRGNAEKRASGELPVWTDTQIQQLVAFLESLSDPSFVSDSSLSDPLAPKR